VQNLAVEDNRQRRSERTDEVERRNARGQPEAVCNAIAGPARVAHYMCEPVRGVKCMRGIDGRTGQA